MKIAIQLFLAAIFIFTGCSEEVVPTPPDYYHLFTGQNKKTWKTTKIVWTGKGKPNITVTDLFLRTCDKDDFYVFYANKDNQYEVSGGNNKCSASEVSTYLSDDWSFVNATATLNIILPFFSDSTLPFYVIKATAKEMTLEIYLDQDNTYSYQVTMQSVSEE